MTSNSFQNGLKKIQVLEQRIDSLLRTRKHDEAVNKKKKLFHFSASFVSIPRVISRLLVLVLMLFHISNSIILLSLF